MELAEDRARVAALEVEILDLHDERIVSALRDEKAAAEERIHSYRYPVLKIPYEVVSNIFAHLLPAYPHTESASRTFPPILVSHVCRAWREIALTNHALWRAISLTGCSLADPIRHILNILSRSGPYPLAIQLNDHGVMDGNRPGGRWVSPISPEVFAAVSGYQARWEHLQLRLYNSYHTTVAGPMPLLRHLDLELSDPKFVFRVDDAPLLRTAILAITGAPSVTLPWAQLTSLTLRRTSISYTMLLLRDTPNLVHCELNLTDNVDVVMNEQITLPFLESFACQSIPSEHPTNFLKIFVVPALRRLQLTEHFLLPNPLDSLASFISTAGCSLWEVCITGTKRVTESEYAAAFPSIQDFSFSGRYQ
ncbi:hypothetical protein DFH06DRAFT_1327386 [Mycena polygramma]|nr:hypothetical protein DFH06DRAFT_1327386 [Mycena polygramma]